MRKVSIENSTTCRSGREALLVYAPNWLGDAVMATPFLFVLRRFYPDMSIHLFCRSYVSEVFRRCSAVDHTIEFGPRRTVAARLSALRGGRPRKGWSTGFVLPPSFSSALVMLLAGVRRRIGYAAGMRRLLLTGSLPERHGRTEHLSRLYIGLAEHAADSVAEEVPLPVVVPPYQWREILAGKGLGEPYIVMAPGAAYGTAKEWPLDRYATLARRLAEHTALPVVAVGAAAEAKPLARMAESAAVPVRSMAGECSPGELLSVLRGAELVIGNDSGPVHLSAAMGRPTVAIFGSTSPAWTAPRGVAVRVVSSDVECAPCFRRSCPEGEPTCLLDIDVEVVFQASRDLLEEVRV